MSQNTSATEVAREETIRQIIEEFNLNPERITEELIASSRDSGVDPLQAMLYLQAYLPIAVGRSLEEAQDRLCAHLGK